MWLVTLVRALFDGLRRRCPRCHRGRMFEKFFTMRTHCPICGNQFERSGGEVSGGMAVNIVATLFIIIVSGVIVGRSTSIPLLPALLVLGVVAIMFPIMFYPISRGLWAGILFLTGNNDEADDVYRR